MSRLLRSTMVLALISFLTFPAFHAYSDPDDKPAPTLRSQKLFEEMMQDPTIRSLYTQIQRHLLNVPSDANLMNAYEGDEILRQLLEYVEQLHNRSLNDMSDQFKASSLLIRKDFLADNPAALEREKLRQYKELDKTIVEVARLLGFPKESIDNREVYIMPGQVNAFTVSGNHSRIIVGVQAGLLEKMTPEQIRAVLGHELGHILSKHSLQSMMTGILLTNVMKHFFSSSPNSTSVQGIFNKLKESFGLGDSPDTRKLMDIATCMTGCTHSFSKNADIFKIMNGLPAPSILRMAEELTRDRMQRQQIQSLAMDRFLSHFVSTLILAEAPQNVIEVFIHLHQNLKSPEAIQVDRETFMAARERALETISRQNETSADRVAGSIIRNEIIAATFMKLMSLEFKDRLERDALLAEVMKNANELLERLSPERLREIIRGTHPPLTLRIAGILNIGKDPTLLFANRFYNILLIQTALFEQVQILESLKFSPDMQDKIPDLEKAQAHFRVRAGNLASNIERMIAEVGFSGKHNPLLRNWLEYNLLQKQKLLLLQESVSNTTDPRQKAKMERAISISELGQKDFEIVSRRILEKAQASLKAANSGSPEAARISEKIAGIERMLQAQTLDQVHQERAAIQAQFKSGSRRAKYQLPLPNANDIRATPSQTTRAAGHELKSEGRDSRTGFVSWMSNQIQKLVPGSGTASKAASPAAGPAPALCSGLFKR